MKFEVLTMVCMWFI